MKNCLFLTILLLPFYAFALDGNFWHEHCNNSNESSCVSYVTGFVDGYEIDKTSSDHREFCIQTGVKSSQLTDIFKKFLYNRPDIRHEKGSVLLAASLIQAFPCE